MSNPLDLSVLDDRLHRILALLESRESNPTVKAAVDHFVTDYSPDEHWGACSLLEPNCRDSWQRDGVVYWGRKLGAVEDEDIDKSRGGERDRLYDVCGSLLRFLLDCRCSVDWEKHRTQLHDALQSYLSIRGYRVDVPAPAAKTKRSEGNGEKKVHGGRRKDPKVQARNKKIAADFRKGLSIDAVAEKYGIGAALARQVKSQAEKKADKSTKNRQS